MALAVSSLVATHLVDSDVASAAPTPACVAGTDYVETTDGADTVLVFSNTSACDWTVPAGVTTIDLLLVGGGGGGGARVGGGGGGGAVVTQSAVALGFPVYTITVGAGGDGAQFDLPGDPNGDNTFHQGLDGGDSVFEGGGAILATAEGGGVGGSWDGTVHSQLPGSGGSGGGSGATTSAGVGSPGGNGGVAFDDTAPHAAGGGGGAGFAGLNGLENSATAARGGEGGLGVLSDIVVRGTGVRYGGGGGGGVHGSWSGSALTAGTYTGGNGSDGGGNGGAPAANGQTVHGGHGTDGLGGGGGGAANSGDSNGSIGGDGGDGIVVLRWRTVVPAQTPSTPVTPIWRATLDPNGGSCLDGTPRTEPWTSIFVGYRYLPNGTDCVRPDHKFTGWATTTDPDTPIVLPELVDPVDGERRTFLAANADLIAMWTRNLSPITDLTVFANFLCGPCTTVWLIHSATDDDVTVDITVGDEPASCNTYAEEFGLAFCELTPLTPGTHTITLTPRHGAVTASSSKTVVALRG